MSDWEPISTAPSKPGSRCIVRDPKHGDVEAVWEDVTSFITPVYAWFQWQGENKMSGPHLNPTHWRPRFNEPASTP